MRYKRNIFTQIVIIMALCFVIVVSGIAQEQESTQDKELVVTAYLASYNHFAPPGGNWGNLPTEAIDWSAFDRLHYFALNVNADGSLSEIKKYKNMSPSRINAVVTAAHSNDIGVFMSIGGWGNYKDFHTAIQPQNRQNLIDNLTFLVKRWHLDGIDLDMEPIKDQDVKNYSAFVRELSGALQQLPSPVYKRPLLSTATSWQPEMFADLQKYFDQINLMTYDYSGAWDGWVTWHNSPIYNGGKSFPMRRKKLPSLNSQVQEFLEAGVTPGKLGIGIDFYGYIWKGVSKPGEGWMINAPDVEDNVPYHKIMKDYFRDGSYNWDDSAQASYLSLKKNGQDLFVSYDDEQAIEAKVQYAREHDLGGVFIWELSAGYRKTLPAGRRDLLLQSVKSAINTSSAL
ncbi:MAG: glycoside hydrolase family 18 protein [Candidatus Marinimicrobia bacterium]|nr:glycoside hydrolase family 18 protein [Candidatus Neomarinimicrobiota bacterium]